MARYDRVRSGIPGLDAILGGGIPIGSRILLAGGTGNGKTLCCAQYIHRGATKYDQPGVYVCTEEPPDEFRRNMRRFGWNFSQLEATGQVAIVDAVYDRVHAEKGLQQVLYDLRSKLGEVKDVVEHMGAARLVIDSLPGFGFTLKDTVAGTIREILLEVGLLLKDLGCTTLMTTEIQEGSKRLSRYGIEEFLATGVIVLRLERNFFGKTVRKLWIRKMRGTSHSLDEHMFTIKRGGIFIDRGILDGLESPDLPRRPRLRRIFDHSPKAILDQLGVSRRGIEKALELFRLKRSTLPAVGTEESAVEETQVNTKSGQHDSV